MLFCMDNKCYQIYVTMSEQPLPFTVAAVHLSSHLPSEEICLQTMPTSSNLSCLSWIPKHCKIHNQIFSANSTDIKIIWCRNSVYDISFLLFQIFYTKETFIFLEYKYINTHQKNCHLLCCCHNFLHSSYWWWHCCLTEAKNVQLIRFP